MITYLLIASECGGLSQPIAGLGGTIEQFTYLLTELGQAYRLNSNRHLVTRSVMLDVTRK